MRKARMLLFVCAGLLAWQFHAGLAEAQPPSNPVVYFSGWVAITANGDYYNSGPDGAWYRGGSAFGGAPAPAFVGGIAKDSRAGVFYGVTAQGDFYWSPGYYGTSWEFRCNVFGGVQPPPDNLVVGCSADWAARQNVCYVLTAKGDVYWSPGWSGEAGYWEYYGNIFDGATPAQPISIGQLKAKYAAPATGK